MDTRKHDILQAITAHVRQRPGLDFANYGDVRLYRSEMRQITRDRHDFDALLSAVQWRDSITADSILAATRAYSGRLTVTEGEDRKVNVEYCTGQYFPTEYRKAACAVLASALWDYARENMPKPDGKVTRTTGSGPFRRESEHDSIEGLSPGDWLRRYFRREFGRGIASRWFN